MTQPITSAELEKLFVNVDKTEQVAKPEPAPQPTPPVATPTAAEDADSPLKAEELTEFNRLFAKIKAREAAMDKLRTQVRVDEIKSNPDIDELVVKFLLEISGVAPFTYEIKIGNVLKFEFEAISSKSLEDIIRQCQRDVLLGRADPTKVDSFMSGYRAVASLKTLSIIDPRPGALMKQHDVWAIARADLPATSEVIPGDLYCRAKYVYCRDNLMATGTLFENFMIAYEKFDKILYDLNYLLTVEPDFFQQR